MFNNIGSKIMKLAKFQCWIGIIFSVISGIAIIVNGASIRNDGYNGGSSVLSGIPVIVLGCLFSWIGSLFIYGFGQLIENTDVIRYNTQHKD